jgi:cell division protein FtsB
MQAVQRSNRELWLAGVTIIVVTFLYLVAVAALSQIPPASQLFGHALGILGFIMMLLTETLYSLRKRSRKARWGRMSDWLNFHIYTGIVGPYLVLLHSSWKFHGLAGLVTLMAALVVASGFIGRYIYTSIPRTADDVEIEASQVMRQLTAIEAELNRRMQGESITIQASVNGLVSEQTLTGNAPRLFLTRAWLDWQERRRWKSFEIRSAPAERAQIAELEQLTRRRDALRRQMASLALARRLFALWHAVHIPLGMLLFVAAFIHIAAAIYFAEML